MCTSKRMSPQSQQLYYNRNLCELTWDDEMINKIKSWFMNVLVDECCALFNMIFILTCVKFVAVERNQKLHMKSRYIFIFWKKKPGALTTNRTLLRYATFIMTHGDQIGRENKKINKIWFGIVPKWRIAFVRITSNGDFVCGFFIFISFVFFSPIVHVNASTEMRWFEYLRAPWLHNLMFYQIKFQWLKMHHLKNKLKVCGWEEKTYKCLVFYEEGKTNQSSKLELKIYNKKNQFIQDLW